MIQIQRSDIRLYADPKRVIIKPLHFGNPARVAPVVQYVSELDDATAEEALRGILEEFDNRHYDLHAAFARHGEMMAPHIQNTLTETKRLLLGAYFTHEYSIQASALFNPSIVPHPDQSGVEDGAMRFVLSLRAVGEGHISSLAFQTGVVGPQGQIRLDPTSPKLSMGTHTAAGSEENYDVAFDAGTPLSSRVIFPHAASEANGIEDVRFVHFSDGQSTRYIGTYTAYSGRSIEPRLIETVDFRHFRIRAMRGKAVSDKGMALFPELIGGKFAMISRQGGRELYFMYSEDLYRWEEYRPLQQPKRGWEMLQIGNCGSPLKTEEGWLLLTHAVGPMRKYVLSLTLLDLDHPVKVISSLNQPLLSPNAEEREGYVPNVLYTCGMMEHHGKLIIPYAMSDSAISFATADVKEVLHELKK